MITNIAPYTTTNNSIIYEFNAEWDWHLYEQTLYQGVTLINNASSPMMLVLDMTHVQTRNADVPEFIDRIPPLFLPNNTHIIVVGGTLLAKSVFYHLHFRYHTERHPVLLAEAIEDVAGLKHAHQTSDAAQWV